ncbi:MAG: alpha-L-rhamnosidase C-terminal domain-containing protein [Capsulimonadales bacterium]|nr:alpha-L-rhamnosidase C-terminal domain-containing protein [Capsulimonadales bacterium]
MTRRRMIQMLAISTTGGIPGEAVSLPPDPRGPIVTPGMRVRIRNGAEAPGYRFTPRHRSGPLRGRWIGTADDTPVALFRREFPLTAVPERVFAYLSADATYRLWLNGRLVSRGPADIGMDYHRVPTGKWFYDVRELTPFLKEGRNVLAAEVFAERLIGWEGTRERGGFLCELEGILGTDDSWLVRPATHWSRRDGYWVYDGAKEPTGWRSGRFDPSGWEAATLLPDRWQPLIASEAPPRMEIVYPPLGTVRVSAVARTPRKGIFPVVLPTDGGFAVRYDRVLSAFVGLTVRGGKGGTLHIEPNEPNAPGYHRRAAIALSGGTQTVELPFLDSFSVINLRAEGLTAPLEIVDVRANFASMPVEYRGEFTCDDPGLNRLWEVCRWVTQICQQTHHLDSPHHQEPISDPGDYLIIALLNYCAFFQPWLVRQDLRKYAWIMEQCGNRVFHTSYSLLWLRMLLDYYDHTGDEALVRELAPSVRSLLETFTGYRGKNGLLCEAPNYMFMDWVDIEGFPGHHPPAVIGQGYLTAFYYRALADGMRVARIVGDTGREAEYGRLREATRTAFEQELWAEEKGRYRDGKPFRSSVKPGQWLPEDRDIETFTAHVNILAVLCDLAPKERQAAILERVITEPGFHCQPYFMHFVFDALAKAGLFERYARAQMARWQIVDDTQSLREMWNTGDLSHAWGATPLYQMSSRILGVRPATPGYREIVIEPHPCGLTEARGVVPTPHGDVRVEWRREGERLTLTAGIPKGCTAEVILGKSRSFLGSGTHVVAE